MARFEVRRADADGEPYGSLLGLVEAETVMEAHDLARAVLGEAWGGLTVTEQREVPPAPQVEATSPRVPFHLRCDLYDAVTAFAAAGLTWGDVLAVGLEAWSGPSAMAHHRARGAAR